MAHQPGNEAAEARGKLALAALLPPPAAAGQVDAGVEVPTDQEDAFAGLEHRLLHQVEIGLGIDDHAHARGRGVAPHARIGRTVVAAAVWLPGRFFFPPHAAPYPWPIERSGVAFIPSEACLRRPNASRKRTYVRRTGKRRPSSVEPEGSCDSAGRIWRARKDSNLRPPDS